MKILLNLSSNQLAENVLSYIFRDDLLSTFCQILSCEYVMLMLKITVAYDVIDWLLYNLPHKIHSMNLEQFSMILIGIIVLIILYNIIGNFFEHRHVYSTSHRFTYCMRRESASSSDSPLEACCMDLAISPKSISMKSCSFTHCFHPWFSQEGITSKRRILGKTSNTFSSMVS